MLSGIRVQGLRVLYEGVKVRIQGAGLFLQVLEELIGACRREIQTITNVPAKPYSLNPKPSAAIF